MGRWEWFAGTPLVKAVAEEAGQGLRQMGRWVVSRSAVGEELALPYMQWVNAFALYLLGKPVTVPFSFTIYIYAQ